MKENGKNEKIKEYAENYGVLSVLITKDNFKKIAAEGSDLEFALRIINRTHNFHFISLRAIKQELIRFFEMLALTALEINAGLIDSEIVDYLSENVFNLKQMFINDFSTKTLNLRAGIKDIEDIMEYEQMFKEFLIENKKVICGIYNCCDCLEHDIEKDIDTVIAWIQKILINMKRNVELPDDTEFENINADFIKKLIMEMEEKEKNPEIIKLEDEYKHMLEHLGIKTEEQIKEFEAEMYSYSKETGFYDTDETCQKGYFNMMNFEALSDGF